MYRINYKNIRLDANTTKQVEIVGSYENATIGVYTDMHCCSVKYNNVWYGLDRGVVNLLDSIRLENGTNAVTLKFDPSIIRTYDHETGQYTERPQYSKAVFSLYISGGML